MAEGLELGPPTGLATDAALTAHAGDTSNVHGIVDTSALVLNASTTGTLALGASSNAFEGESARLVVQPSSGDEENGIVVISPNDTWGDEGTVPYGTGQAFMLLKEDPAGTLSLTDRVLYRVDRRGAIGLTGGLHVATGLRQRPDFVQNYSIFSEPNYDIAAHLQMKHGVGSPTGNFILASDSSAATAFKVGPTGQIHVGATTGFGNSVGAVIPPAGAWTQTRASSASGFLQAGVTGDTFARVAMNCAGQLSWGPGGANVADVTMRRSAAATLTIADAAGSGAGHLAILGNVGFYGTAPIAKQTGVAVTAEGIHAALVNLGLIAA